MLKDVKTSLRRTSRSAGSLASRELGEQARRLNSDRSLRRRAFTLIEMMIVMGIIILAVSLAIPAIRILTGSRSEQAAQNTIAAFLARARAEAIGLQRTEGVLFYIDAATDRVTLTQVWQSPFQPGDPNSGIVFLDVVPDHDNLVLPPGIRVWTIKDQAPSGFTDPFLGYRYLGYNPTTYGATDKAALGGVILFDGHGRIATEQYGFRFVDHITGPANSLLGQTAFFTPSTSTVNWPGTSSSYLRSQIGVVFFDRETFINFQGGTGVANPDSNTAGQEATIDPWLDNNSTPVLVNRYNGTLLRGE